MNSNSVATKKTCNSTHQGINNLRLGFKEFVHIYSEVWIFNDDTTVCGMTDVFDNFCIVKIGLGWNTTTVQAGSTKFRFLNKGNLTAELGSFNGCNITSRTSTNHNDIKSIIALTIIV